MTTTTTTELYYRDGRLFTGAAHLNEDGKPVASTAVPCGRCGGAGGSGAWKHTGWTCYDCKGSGRRVVTARLYTAEQNAKLDATAAKREAKAVAKRAAAAAAAAVEADARRAAFFTTHAALLARVADLDDATVKDIVGKATERAALSPAQAALLATIADRHAARLQAQVTSGHVGVEGQRLNIPVTVAAIRSYERAGYGFGGGETVWVVTFVDAAGNQLVTKSPTAKRNLAPTATEGDLTEGAVLTVRGTVKAHSEYNGVKQTELSRVALVEGK